MFKLGLIINPYAGIGGALGLKGSDGCEIRTQALAQGASMNANPRMAQCLSALADLTDDLTVFTAGGLMGEQLAREMGFNTQVVYQPKQEPSEASDTEHCATLLVGAGVDLILFAGGDGTARNICAAVGERVAVLGVPAGCKIHSGVYAVTPAAAGRVVRKMVQGELLSLQQADVRDIDEDAFRAGRVQARPYGEMNIPADLEYIQATKTSGRESEELVLMDIADYIGEMMDESPQTLFVMGSGSTVDFIMQQRGLANTLLGVDVVRDNQLLASDVSASQLLSLISGQPVKLVITLIGGQGHVLGRGNQQLSPAVIEQVGKENILLVASKTKLQALNHRPLITDSGDVALDKRLSGVISVITGYWDKVVYPLRSPGNDDEF